MGPSQAEAESQRQRAEWEEEGRREEGRQEKQPPPSSMFPFLPLLMVPNYSRLLPLAMFPSPLPPSGAGAQRNPKLLQGLFPRQPKFPTKLQWSQRKNQLEAEVPGHPRSAALETCSNSPCVCVRCLTSHRTLWQRRG